MQSKRKVVLDIEANGLLDENTLDYTKTPYRLKPSFKMHCIVAKDIETNEIFCFYDYPEKILFEDVEYKYYPLSKFRSWVVNCVDQIIGHNIIDYDLLAMRLYFNLPYKVGPDLLDGREVTFDDTLVMSRTLNPDRFGGHSLASFGKRVHLDKIEFGKEEDQWEVFTPEMLYYCIRDVELNHRVLNYLKLEWSDWKWEDAYQLEKKVADIITRQKHIGFKFNREKATEHLNELNGLMGKIESEVEPLLPEKAIGKTAAKEFIPPASQFKKSGEIATHFENFLAKHGGEVVEWEEIEVGVRKKKIIRKPLVASVFGKNWEIPIPQEPMVTTEKMKLSHTSDIKLHVMEMGWIPTTWKEKDLSIDQQTKRKLPEVKYQEVVARYVEDTLGKPWEKERCEHLGVDSSKLRLFLLQKDTKKPVKVLTTPEFTINQEKDLCPNLEKLGDKVKWVGDFVKWLTYRHRRNAIFSSAENSVAKTKDSGWLAHPRLNIDGRIPTPANTCGCNTTRFQHKEVVNVPRNTSMYGEQMRELFGVDGNSYQIGYDADGLEARIEAHYTIRYPGGKKYANSLIAEKPNDVHTQTKNTIIELTGLSEFTRDNAKTVKYACAYGAQPPKLAKQNGWSIDMAQKVFNGYWEAAKPLAMLKKDVANFWRDRGERKWVVAIDGRKLFTRSEHSLINTLFQSAGVICMKRAMVWLDAKLEKAGILLNPFEDDLSTKKGTFQMIAYHDEGQNSVSKELVKFKTFENEDKAKEFKTTTEVKSGKMLSGVGHVGDKYYVAYSKVGELAAASITYGGKYYKLRVPLTAGYEVGMNWAQCH